MYWLQNQYQKLFFLNSHSRKVREVTIVRICFLMPVVQVKWVGMLSPCLQFPVTLNLISPNHELSPVPLHISDCTAHVSAPCSSWLHCSSPVSYLPLHICTSPVPTLCISLSGEGFFFQEDSHRMELQGAAPRPARWGLPALPQPGRRGREEEEEEGLLSAPVRATWVARWASARAR